MDIPPDSTEVWILWGQSGIEMKEENDPNWKNHLSHYEFDTLPELNAFLKGIHEAMEGWENYEQFDTDPTKEQS